MCTVAGEQVCKVVGAGAQGGQGWREVQRAPAAMLRRRQSEGVKEWRLAKMNSSKKRICQRTVLAYLGRV